MFTIKQSYNQMKYAQHYLWDEILFLVPWTASSREKKGEKKKGSSSGVPGIGYYMSKHLYHQPQVVKTDFHPRKTAVLCSETALEGITGLLPYLKKYILPEGCMLGWYKVTFLARTGVASAARSGLGTQAAFAALATLTLSNQASRNHST